MTVFKTINFNTSELDSLFSYLQNCNCIHKPLIAAEEQNIVSSKDSSSKAQLLFEKIIDWQNELTKQRIAPGSKIIWSREEHFSFGASQKALNKLKRKFNKLFLKNLSQTQIENLALEKLAKVDSERLEVMKYVIERFGYNDLCLKTFAPIFGGCELLEAKKPDDLIAFPVKNERPFFISQLALADVLIKKPRLANTWGYPGEEITPMAVYTPEAFNAVNARLDETRAEAIKNFDPTMSKFKKIMTRAKSQEGYVFASCDELGDELFRALTRDRLKFKTVALCYIQSKPGAKKSDETAHAFVMAQGSREKQRNVLEGWDKVMIYRESETYENLRGWIYQQDPQGRAITKKFNPKKQTIKVITYNLYPYEAFQKDSTIKHAWFLETLKAFHQTSDEDKKISLALYMISFIENKMPLYEFYDPAIHELYDQLMYLTKKERKKGVKLDFEADLIPINDALKKSDMPRLKQYLSEKKPMDDHTLLHAMKTSYLTGDMDYYNLVSAAWPKNISTPLTESIDSDPNTAVALIYKDLFSI